METLYNQDKNHNPTQTIEWLENRFILFEKYCFPSIKNQSNKNFIWLVLFSQETPNKYKEKIRSYELIFSRFKPIYLSNSDYSRLKVILHNEIFKYLTPNDEYVITSRIDSDDTFHKDIISEIQSIFEKQDNLFINFNWGFQYDQERRILTRLKYINNHFISKIEKISDDIQTVLNYNHANINNSDTQVIYVNNKEKPLWIEVIHSNNISNRLHLDAVPIFNNRILSSFGFTANISMYQTLSAFYGNRKRLINISTGNFLRRIGVYDNIRSFYRHVISAFN